MTTTSCIISFGSNAIAIKEDATFSTTSLNALGNLDDLANDTTALKPFATYEPNFWLLDGSYKFAPDTGLHGGYISAAMSPANPASDFTVAPKITILFSELHSTEEITLIFSEFTGDWSDKISIGFFNGGTTLSAAFYTPTSAVFTLPITVSNFNKIEIFFYSQNKAYRYARLSEIRFDEAVVFSGSDIKSANLIEQISVISTELPFNTIDFTIFSNTGDFNIVSPSGIYSKLQNKDSIDVFESIDNNIIYIGRFYLDTWKSKSANEAEFHASDQVALLETYQYLGGVYSGSGIDSDVLIAEIFNAADLEYDLDSSLNGIKIDGLIQYLGDCRNALQQVLFYLGAYATCARSKIIQIKPIPTVPNTADYTLSSSEKSISSSVDLRPFVTGVEIKEWKYTTDLNAVGTTLFSKTLAVGTHIISLSSKENKSPAAGLIMSGSATYTITLNRLFYCIVNVTVAGTVVLQEDERNVPIDSTVGVYNGSLAAGIQQNIIKIENATLMTSTSVSGTISTSDVAQRVYDYYQHRMLQKVKLFGFQINVADCVTLQTQGGEINGIVEKVKTNLSGGFVSDAEIVGDII